MKSWYVLVLAAVTTGAVLVGEDIVDKGGKPPKTTEHTQPIRGQCHCGYVKYEAKTPVVKCSYCDCRGCQRASGSLKVPFVTVRRANVRIVEGKPATFKATSSAPCDSNGTWHFCPRCGTHVFWKGTRGADLDLFAGTLDDPSVFKPGK